MASLFRVDVPDDEDFDRMRSGEISPSAYGDDFDVVGDYPSDPFSGDDFDDGDDWGE